MAVLYSGTSIEVPSAYREPEQMSISVETSNEVKKLLESAQAGNKADREKLDKILLEQAKVGMKSTYSPYSEFPVGASLLTKSGELFLGCNVENASYGGTICAERTAVVKAISEGHLKFDSVAVVCQKNLDAWPCGFCRQFMAEFGGDLRIVVEGSSGKIEVMTMNELLPNMFGPGALGK